MKKLIVLSLISISLCGKHSEWHHCDFDESMQTRKFPRSIQVTQQITGIEGEKLIGKFRDLYNKYNLTKVTPSETVKIPKIIHQIWLGSPLPEEFKEYMKSWLHYHAPGWKYVLWTDENVKEIMPLYNQEYYDQSDNYGVKSDILKWELIYRYGGVYIDVDYECLRPLDIFHHTYDFYTGIQPLDTQFLQLGAALFGAWPGHPILKHCIETIKDDWHKKGAPGKTGPVHYTRSFYAVAGSNDNKDIALPASYFYPLGCLEKEYSYEQWIKNGAYAIHHWAKSWMPLAYRLPKFRTINNTKSSNSWND